MSDLATKKTNYINRFITSTGDLLSAAADLKALVDEYNAMGYGSLLQDGDFTTQFPWLDATTFNTAVGTLNALLYPPEGQPNPNQALFPILP